MTPKIRLENITLPLINIMNRDLYLLIHFNDAPIMYIGVILNFTKVMVMEHSHLFHELMMIKFLLTFVVFIPV